MLGSRIKALDAALATIIDAGTDSTVTVTRGHPGEELTREAVWTDDIEFDERAKSLQAGQNPRRQEITAIIVVRIRQEGLTNAELRDRAADVADQVEEALRANINLSGAVDFGGVVAGTLGSFKDTDGRVGTLPLTATYTATKSA